MHEWVEPHEVTRCRPQARPPGTHHLMPQIHTGQRRGGTPITKPGPGGGDSAMPRQCVCLRVGSAATLGLQAPTTKTPGGRLLDRSGVCWTGGRAALAHRGPWWVVLWPRRRTHHVVARPARASVIFDPQKFGRGLSGDVDGPRRDLDEPRIDRDERRPRGQPMTQQCSPLIFVCANLSSAAHFSQFSCASCACRGIAAGKQPRFSPWGFLHAKLGCAHPADKSDRSFWVLLQDPEA